MKKLVIVFILSLLFMPMPFINTSNSKPDQIDLFIVGGIGINFECINMEDHEVNVHWYVDFNGILYDFFDDGYFSAAPGTMVTKHYSISGFGIVKAHATANGITVERNGIVLWIFVIFVD